MRCILTVTALVLALGEAWADIPPPPPPKGKKYIPIANSVTVDKSVIGYAYYVQVASFPGNTENRFESVQLSEKPVAMPEGGRRINVTLYAVPEAEAKKFATEKELAEALRNNKVKGSQALSFGSSDVTDVADVRKALPWTHAIKSIDSDGMKVEKLRDGKPAPTKPGQQDTDEPEARLAKPFPQSLLVGGCLAAAVVGLGMWLVGRRRPV